MVPGFGYLLIGREATQISNKQSLTRTLRVHLCRGEPILVRGDRGRELVPSGICVDYDVVE